MATSAHHRGRPEREAPSSYGQKYRAKGNGVTRSRKRGPKLHPTVVPSYAAHPPTQDERVAWARRELRVAINRANAARLRDPLLNAVVEGRRRDLDRELRALEAIETRTRAPFSLWTPPHARLT